MSENSLVTTIARMRVSGVTLIRFTIGLPRVFRPACGNSCTFEPETPPIIGENEHVRVRTRHVEPLDEVVFLEIRAGLATTTTPCRLYRDNGVRLM